MGMLLILKYKMINSKKGAEKILSIYWFVILIITVVGIYGMVTLYYHHPYDIRELEANLLANKIADCISNKGELIENLFNDTSGEVSEEFNKNFLENCRITFNVEDKHNWKKRFQYYLEVNFYDIDLKSLGSISKGEKIWEKDCEINKGEDYEKLVKCVNTRFYSLYKDKPILIDILSIIRKTEKNVK